MVDVSDRIAFICVGNHNKTLEVRERIRKALDVFQMEGMISTRDLAKAFDWDLEIPADKAKFYRFLRPLKGDNVLGLTFLVSNRGKDGQIYWKTSPEAFRTGFDNLKKSITNRLIAVSQEEKQK